MNTKLLLLLLLITGCASHRREVKPEDAILYATPDCTRLKEPCPIKNGQIHNCQLVLTCTQVGKKNELPSSK